MEASLTVPTATSVRAVPAKLLIDNRTVINNHLARGRGGGRQPLRDDAECGLPAEHADDRAAADRADVSARGDDFGQFLLVAGERHSTGQHVHFRAGEPAAHDHAGAFDETAPDWTLLVGQAGRQVRLRVNGTASEEGARDEVVALIRG